VSADKPGLIAPEERSGDAEPARTNGASAASPSPLLPKATEDTDFDGPRPVPHRLTRRERRKLNRLRARKVRRVVRHVDPWSVLLVSLGFYLCLFVILMVAGVLLWTVASTTGTIEQLEGVIKESFAEKSFSFEGTKIFRASLLGGLVLVIAGSAFNVLLCTLFNLMSDLVGGIRVTVIEEETAKPVR
jgi:hypothetical protein